MNLSGSIMKTRLLSTLLCLLVLASLSLSEGKRKVAVEHTGADMLGQQLAYKLKEQLNKSGYFVLVSSDEAVLTIHVTTSDIGTFLEEELVTPAGTYSACSAIYTNTAPNESLTYYCWHN